MPLTWSQEQYIKAYRYAAEAHRGQTFRGTDLPYLLHVTLVCMEVLAAFRVEKGLNEPLGVQCALLHDVLEDTDRTYDQLKTEFSREVADGVLALSKNSNLPKQMQLEDSLRRIRLQPREIWMVKLGDRITNLQPPPLDWTKQKIASYREDALEIYNALGDASPFLAGRLQHKIESYRMYL